MSQKVIDVAKTAAGKTEQVIGTDSMKTEGKRLETEALGRRSPSKSPALEAGSHEIQYLVSLGIQLLVYLGIQLLVCLGMGIQVFVRLVRDPDLFCSRRKIQRY